MLESLISEKGGKKAPRKALDQQHLTEMDNFHKISFFWSYLLNFSGEFVILEQGKGGIEINPYCFWFPPLL